MWYLYILRCADNTLYTGVTKNLLQREEEHNTSQKGAKYTRSRRPVQIVYSSQYPDRSSACKEETRIKKLSRQEKLDIISNE